MNPKIKNISLWKKYKNNNDLSARKELILDNLNLVKYQAGRINMLVPDFIDKEDLESYGIVGLLEAVENFDYSRGIQFNTFASSRIRGAILDHLRNLDWLSSSLRRKARKIKNIADNLADRLGRNPTIDEIAKETDIPASKITQIYKKIDNSNWVSLYDDFGDSKVIDFIKGDIQEQPEKKFQKQEAQKILSEAIKKLPEDEGLIISLYYYEELTQKEIAVIMDLSSARVSQLHKKAVFRLRGYLGRKKEEILVNT